MRPQQEENRKQTKEDQEIKARRDINITYSDNGWANQSFTNEWENKTFSDTSFFNRLLIWDSNRCHFSDETKKQLKKKQKLDVAMIPGGVTSLIQAPDISWNKPFKASLRNQYDDCLAGEKHSFTQGGNMRACTKSELCDMVLIAWASVSEEIIKKSFVL